MEDMKVTAAGYDFGLRTLPCSDTLMGIFCLDSLPQCSSAEIW